MPLSLQYLLYAAIFVIFAKRSYICFMQTCSSYSAICGVFGLYAARFGILTVLIILVVLTIFDNIRHMHYLPLILQYLLYSGYLRYIRYMRIYSQLYSLYLLSKSWLLSTLLVQFQQFMGWAGLLRPASSEVLPGSWTLLRGFAYADSIKSLRGPYAQSWFESKVLLSGLGTVRSCIR